MTALLETPTLPDFLHGQAPEETDEGFKIDDERKAAWAASKVLAARRRIAHRVHLADAYQDRILDWLTRANHADQASVAFLEASLRPWVENAVSQGRSRSILLPGARLGLRKKPDKVEVLDPEATLAFCQEHLEEVVVTKHELSKSELKKHLDRGARIPGAQLVPGTDELSVTEDSKGVSHD